MKLAPTQECYWKVSELTPALCIPAPFAQHGKMLQLLSNGSLVNDQLRMSEQKFDKVNCG